jgi:hypothetical protein
MEEETTEMSMSPHQILRYDIGRLMSVYKEKYDKLKSFRDDFNINFIQSLYYKLDSLHTLCDRENATEEYNFYHANLQCVCDVNAYLYPSLNAFSIALNEFLKAFEQAKKVSFTLSEIYKKICDCCISNNRQKIDIPNFRQEIKEFYHLSFRKAFEKAFTEMKKAIALYDIYVNNDILYNRLGIEID